MSSPTPQRTTDRPARTALWIVSWIVLLLLQMSVLGQAASGAQIAMDRGVRAAGLWCFPFHDQPNQYVYLPAAARLSTDQQGAPKFSFVRYVINKAGSGNGSENASSTLTAAAGGGILHFLVELDTPADRVTSARAVLRERFNNDDLELLGPMIFDHGRFTLVSSILNPATTTTERRVIATGRAPVLEGNRLALSFDLSPQQATLLLNSLQMATPDVSIVFEMTFHGLSEAYQAELLIDWSEVRRSESFSAGGSAYFISADVETAFDELQRNQAIQLVTHGSDTTMEALLDTVYSKLLELLFQPVEPEAVPESKRGGLMDALETLLDTRDGPLGSRRTTGFGAYAGYRLKELRSSGVSRLNFNHHARVERHAFITFNMGDLFSRYGQDPRYFQAVNLDDPTFQQREIRVGIDGALLSELDRFINSATVTLRKRHEDGGETLREVVIDREVIESTAGDLRLVYGWKGDHDRLGWLSYETRTRWSFKGGGAYETPWQPTDAAMVEIFAPYERRTVQLSGDLQHLTELGVRAVIVQVEYPFFGEIRRQQMVTRVAVPADAPSLEITLPRNQFEVDYRITWRFRDRTVVSSGRDGSGLIFIDELPADKSTPVDPTSSAQGEP